MALDENMSLDQSYTKSIETAFAACAARQAAATLDTYSNLPEDVQAFIVAVKTFGADIVWAEDKDPAQYSESRALAGRIVYGENCDVLFSGGDLSSGGFLLWLGVNHISNRNEYLLSSPECFGEFLHDFGNLVTDHAIEKNARQPAQPTAVTRQSAPARAS